MAKKKPEAETESPADASDEKITKSEAVRRALAEGVDSPTDGIAFIKSKFGLDMTTQQFSTAKFQANKKTGAAPGKRRQKRAAAPANGARTSGGISSSGKTANPADLARAVKELVRQHGAAAITDMVKVFAD